MYLFNQELHTEWFLSGVLLNIKMFYLCMYFENVAISCFIREKKTSQTWLNTHFTRISKGQNLMNRFAILLKWCISSVPSSLFHYVVPLMFANIHLPFLFHYKLFLLLLFLSIHTDFCSILCLVIVILKLILWYVFFSIYESMRIWGMFSSTFPIGSLGLKTNKVVRFALQINLRKPHINMFGCSVS